jgi:hypothetical protein
VNTADLVNTYFSEKLKYPAKIENYENKKYTKLKKKDVFTYWISRNLAFSHESLSCCLQISLQQIVVDINIQPEIPNIYKN